LLLNTQSLNEGERSFAVFEKDVSLFISGLYTCYSQNLIKMSHFIEVFKAMYKALTEVKL